MKPTRLFAAPALASALAAAIATSPAAAQVPLPVTFSAEAMLVTDYRFRGLSFSDRDPAAQLGARVDTITGLYAGAWGSTIAEFNGADVELNFYGGWTGGLDLFNVDAGVIGYVYPGGEGTDLYEVYGSVGSSLGPLEARVGVNFAPNQGNIDRSNRYLYGTVSAGIPATPITVRGHLGFERGGLVADETGQASAKTDWLIGAEANFAPFVLGVSYVGNDLPRRFALPNSPRANDFARGAVVANFGVRF